MFGYNKYKVAPAKERMSDGILFASKKEMHRYWELKQDLHNLKIKHLKLQPRFVLLPALGAYNELIYIADFMYEDVATGKIIVEEVKGFETREYKIKAHLFVSRYPQYEYKISR